MALRSCLAASTGYVEKGIDLFKNRHPKSFFSQKGPDFTTDFGMSYYRFEEWKKMFIYSFVDPNVDKSDPWWRVRGIINEYNENRKSNIAAGAIKVLDESMSAWHPQTTKTGRLPHISFIIRKPEPLGTEFKVIASPALNVGLAIELQEGKEPMQQKNPQNLGSTAACMHRLVEMTRGLNEDGNGFERCIILGDSWFGSYDCVVDGKRKLGQEVIYVIKTGHRKTPKKALDEVMKHWAAGTHVVFTTTDKGVGDECDVELVWISYKYNTRTVLHFLMTKDAAR